MMNHSLQLCSIGINDNPAPFHAISKDGRMADKRFGVEKISRGFVRQRGGKRTKGSFERDLAASGSNQNSFLRATREESIIAAKLKRNTPFHACTHVCVCVYASLDELRIFSRVRHCRGWLESPSCSSPFSSTFIPLTNHLDTSKPAYMAFIKWRIINKLSILVIEDRFLLVKQNRGCGWSLFLVFPFWDTRICANDRFIFVLNFNFINKDIWTNWTINLIHFFFRSIITILYHSFDYYRLVSLVLSLSLLLLSN